MYRYLGIYLFAALVLTEASLQAQECTLLFPKRIANESNIEKTMEKEIKRLSEERFYNVKVNVVLKQIYFTPSEGYLLGIEEVLEGINIENSDHPDGLSWGVTGGSALSLYKTCIYLYRVIITTKGTRRNDGQKLSTRTESQLDFEGPTTGKLKCS